MILPTEMIPVLAHFAQVAHSVICTLWPDRAVSASTFSPGLSSRSIWRTGTVTSTAGCKEWGCQLCKKAGNPPIHWPRNRPL
jgi:hypothetical protein